VNQQTIKEFAKTFSSREAGSAYTADQTNPIRISGFLTTGGSFFEIFFAISQI
jgi:hypothetical protein